MIVSAFAVCALAVSVGINPVTAFAEDSAVIPEISAEIETSEEVIDILQYIVAQNATSFTIIGYARASGAGTFINSSTLTYTSKAYVRL